MQVWWRVTRGSFAASQYRFAHGHHTALNMKKYMCVICGFEYDEEQGLPDEGIPPGTKWEDVPLNWKCPECGASKEDFEMIEV